MIFPWIASILISAIVAVVYRLYRHESRSYATGKSEKIEALPGLRVLYKPLMLSIMALALLGLHLRSRWLLALAVPIGLRWLGLAMGVAGATILVWARRSLGVQYSPCFDSWAATSLVATGPYRIVRHPMYLSNLVMIAGFTLASGSAWIAIFFLVFLVYFSASAYYEERRLQMTLAGYTEYMKGTGRILPRLLW
jgi:protein-S-isoprenylcysteine O-methyltransferase